MNMNQDNDNNILHESSGFSQMGEILFDTLSVEDWITIQSVRSLFSSTFQDDHVQCPFDDRVDRASAFISWSERANQVALLFINFFRQIGEFEGLHGDDRFILIKYNLFPLFPILRSYNYKVTGDCCSRGDNEEAARHRRFFMLCDSSTNVREKFVNLILSLVEVTEQDPTILSLLLVTLLFSQGLSMSEDEPSLKDSLAVFQAQAHYTEILWNYLVNKQGEIEASRCFTQLLTCIFRIQSAAKVFREFFRVQLIKTDTVDRIAPLMQSVLHIS
jgi:hypothetical protein